MKSAEPPVLQFSEEVSGADTAGQVELPLAVDTEDVLKHPGRPVKEEFTVGQRVRVADGDDLI